MTLSFSTHWADGKPNYFVGKIWSSILNDEYNKKYRKRLTQKLYDQYYHNAYGICLNKDITHPNDFFGEFGYEIDYAEEITPKLHTLREDKKDRWKAGKKIHPVINNRTPNRFQFAPTMPCISTQKVEVIKDEGIKAICIDDWILYHSEGNMGCFEKTLQFVKNDGFDDIESFFEYFFPNGQEGTKTLKLIHWTDLKY